MGHTPFQQPGEEGNELVLFRRICSHTEDLTFIEDISDKSRDLIGKLLTSDPQQRLCCGGVTDSKTGGSEIRSHPIFEGLDWSKFACSNLDNPLKAYMRQKFETVRGSTEEEPPMETYSGSGQWFKDF